MAMSDRERNKRARERRLAKKYQELMRKARLRLTAKGDPPAMQIAVYHAALKKAGKIKDKKPQTERKGR